MSSLQKALAGPLASAVAKPTEDQRAARRAALVEQRAGIAAAFRAQQGTPKQEAGTER